MDCLYERDMNSTSGAFFMGCQPLPIGDKNYWFWRFVIRKLKMICSIVSLVITEALSLTENQTIFE
jgi:hypothetical protein